MSGSSFARKDRPSGDEAAKKAKAAKLDTAKAITAKNKGGKSVKFTPAAHGKMKAADMETGHMIGTIDSQVPVGAKKLPPGKYNVVGAKRGAKWTAYLESNGKIVGMAKLTVTKETAKKSPSFKKKKAKKAKNPKKKDFGGEVEPLPMTDWDEDEDLDFEGVCWEDETGIYCEEVIDVVCEGDCDEWFDE